MKTCPKCLKSEPEITFGVARARYDGKAPYCRACWTLYIQQGRWAKGTKRTPPFLERLWEGIQVCEHGIDCPFCCWPWLKGRDKDGYGKMGLNVADGAKVHLRVTRVLYEVWHGVRLLSEQLICHYCDNPPCCNYNHFWLGDRISNRQDCVAKRRHAIGARVGSVTHPETVARGEKQHQAKLTERDVLHIRDMHADGMAANAISKLYGVAKQTILCVVKRRTWTHI